jgi:Domain of unknown function (DUF4157)
MTHQAQAVKTRRVVDSPTAEHQARRAKRVTAVPAAARRRDVRVDLPLTGGRPMPEALRRPLEVRLGHDLRTVRLHTGPEAAVAARALGAEAYAYGHDVGFAPGRFDPASTRGSRLLAHEVAHVVQQSRTGGPPVVQLQPAEETAPVPHSRLVPRASMSVSLSGLNFNSYEYYEPGPKRPQAIAMVLARLLGDEYRQGLEQRVLAAIEAENMTFTGDWADPAAVAGDKEVIGRIGLNAPAVMALIDILRGMELEPELSEQQHQILRMAWYTEHAWQDVRKIGPETAELPAWYYEHKYLFDRAMASQGELLAAYGLTVEAEKQGEAGAAERRADAARDLILAIAGAVDVLEQIRVNGELRRDKTVARLVGVLWVVPEDGGEPTELADVQKAATFLGFVWSQPKLMEERAHTAALKEMLWRFARFYVRELSVGGGDEPLLPKPSKVNASPYPAELVPKPQLTPPLYEAAQEWDLRTRMSIDFPTVFAAFAARFDFRWERLRVPTKGEGAKPGTTPTKEQAVETVSGLYASEQGAHAEIDTLIRNLGPPGVGAPSLSAAQKIAIFTGQRGPDYFVKNTRGEGNSSDWGFKFTSPGIFVVRCTARQRRDSDAEFQRAPSVTYIPIFIRPASVMVEEQARTLLEEQTRDKDLIPEIDAMLTAPLLPPEVQKELLQLREDLAASQEGAGAMLKLQESRLAKQWDEIKDSNTVSEREKRDVKRRLEEVRLILETRGKRVADESALATAGRLLATFISDGGQTLPLLMEVADLPPTEADPYRVHVSDLTMSKSGESTGGGKTRAKAIEDAVTQILQGEQGYDTGWVAFVVDDVPIRTRIGKSKGKLLAEAIDKASLFLTIAAILAAPFTGGASLWLLIPVAIAAAGTSLYRILSRAEAHVLRADLETLLDIVNIIGGVVAPIRVAASGLRLMRLGRTMMVIGLGNDGAGMILMGASIAQQLDAVKDLPWDERSAAIQVILGQALFQVGLVAGGELAQIGIRRRAMLKALDPKRRPPAPKNPRRTGAPDPGAKDRTMAGINQEPKGTTVLPRKGRQRPTRPGHDDPLLAALEKEGVRREPPPPYKVTEPIKDNMTLKERFNDYESAYAAYDAVVAAAAGREVAICRDQKTGVYAVQIGTTTSVGKPSGGKWRTLLHFHPNKENVLRFRLPAPQDFNELMFRFLRSKRNVREFLEYDIPGVGRGRTEFGITPGHAEPFYVKTYMPDGTVSEVRFTSDGPFHAYWGKDTIFVEKGSDVYDAMMRDLDVWRSQIDRSLVEKTIAGAITTKPEAVKPLQTDRGDLTQAGLDFLRQNVKALRHASDDQIRAKFLTEGFAFEVLAREELRRLSAPKQTKTTFLLTKPRMKLSWVIERIRIARKQKKPSATPPLLTEGVHEFIERTPSLRALRDEGLNSPDPRIRDAWEIFYYGEKLPRGPRQPRRPARRGERLPRGFFYGRVGDKEPDALTIDLDNQVIRVIDFTQQIGVKIHSFKTLFYKLVLGEATGLGVTAVDYRSQLRQTEIKD